MKSNNSLHSRISRLGIPTVAIALCVSVISAAQTAAEVAPAGDLQRFSQAIKVFEIARSHIQQWESNPAARSLVAQMTDDLVREARLDVSWKARLFLKEEGRTDQAPDEFERMAITNIGDAKSPGKDLWNAERNRVVSAVMAHKSCVNCHETTVGDVMGYVSLEFKPGQRAIKR